MLLNSGVGKNHQTEVATTARHSSSKLPCHVDTQRCDACLRSPREPFKFSPSSAPPCRTNTVIPSSKCSLCSQYTLVVSHQTPGMNVSRPLLVPERPWACINVRSPPRLSGMLDRSRYARDTYVPIWKPLENLRATFLRVRMRPVPVVFLRLAFSLHSTDCRQYIFSFSRPVIRTLSDLSSGEAARRAGALLDMPRSPSASVIPSA